MTLSLINNTILKVSGDKSDYVWMVGELGSHSRSNTQFRFTIASIPSLSWNSFPGGKAAINLTLCVSMARCCA